MFPFQNWDKFSWWRVIFWACLTFYWSNLGPLFWGLSTSRLLIGYANWRVFIVFVFSHSLYTLLVHHVSIDKASPAPWVGKRSPHHGRQLRWGFGAQLCNPGRKIHTQSLVCPMCEALAIIKEFNTLFFFIWIYAWGAALAEIEP